MGKLWTKIESEIGNRSKSEIETKKKRINRINYIRIRKVNSKWNKKR